MMKPNAIKAAAIRRGREFKGMDIITGKPPAGPY
jgi:hypothetical protein